MSVQFNHTIIHTRDKKASAAFLADLLGLEVGAQYGPFMPVVTANGVTLDFDDRDEIPQHYAFLVSEEEFDAIFERIQRAGVTYYADQRLERAGEINRRDGGRGTYFRDPNGHVMEIITRPYGSMD